MVQRDPAGIWRQVRGWISSQTHTWSTSSSDFGYSVFYFHARQPGPGTLYEAYAGPLYYAINCGTPCTNATLAASPSSPQPLDTSSVGNLERCVDTDSATASETFSLP